MAIQEKKNNAIEELVKDVEKLSKNTPEGVIVDADTILADIMEVSDFHFTGFAQDIFDIWKASSDKKAVEQIFFEFTDMEFEEYLTKCEMEISKRED